MILRWLLAGLSVLCVHAVWANSHYVSPQGASSGNGSREHPWDLQTALFHPAGIMPGDTLWVQGGTYPGAFTSTLAGTSQAPIVVRVVPGQVAVLDGNVPEDAEAVLSILGQHTWYWGLTITNSSAGGASHAKDGVYLVGAHNRLINCVIRDNGGNGVGFWSSAIGSEIYGSIIYHNGVRGPTRGHGHGIYTQNQEGTKRIHDNIMFNSFGNGIQIYTERGSIQGYSIQGNTIFNSGLPGADHIDRNIIVGGLQPADRIAIVGNTVFNRPWYSSKASVQLGYSVPNGSAEFRANVMVNGTLHIIRGWDSLVVTGNRFYSMSPEMQLVAIDDFASIAHPLFAGNAYHQGSLNNLTFSAWQALSGEAASSSFSPDLPSQSTYHLVPNRYERGRGHVVIHNWGLRHRVPVDLSPLLALGQEFEVRDALHLSGPPLLTGVFAGQPLEFPTNLTAVDLPVLEDSNREAIAHTLPHFGVFLVTPGSITPTGPAHTPPMALVGGYPNPATTTHTLTFRTATPGWVRVELIDALGRIVYVQRYLSAQGVNTLPIDVSSLPTGVYLVAIANAQHRVVARMAKR